jgi:hypothetical protein
MKTILDWLTIDEKEAPEPRRDLRRKFWFNVSRLSWANLKSLFEPVCIIRFSTMVSVNFRIYRLLNPRQQQTAYFTWDTDRNPHVDKIPDGDDKNYKLLISDKTPIWILSEIQKTVL